MDEAPGDERPPRPVPEAAEEHRQQQVPIRDRGTAPAAAERDVQVVAQPARERDVPAAPEILQRHGRVGRVEVERELEAEQEGDADGDVRVAGEVGIDLHRVRVDRDQDLERRVLVGVGEDLVDDVRGQVARDHHLLEQPGRDQVEGATRVHAARRARRVELRDQLVGPHDRAGDQVREEREVGGELLESRRLRVSPVHVDDVADPHEGEEGDPHRQDHGPHLERDARSRRPSARFWVELTKKS